MNLILFLYKNVMARELDADRIQDRNVASYDNERAKLFGETCWQKALAVHFKRH